MRRFLPCGRRWPRAGWFLASGNAYVPSPPFPGMADWLYTGRAFAFTPHLQAGWAVAMRGFWSGRANVWVRTRYGMVPRASPARAALEYGRARAVAARLRAGWRPGPFGPAPGYWLDFTALADGLVGAPAGPERLALGGSARYNEFVLTSGLDWRAAMLNLPSARPGQPDPSSAAAAGPTCRPAPHSDY
jgi:hypothetical protein